MTYQLRNDGYVLRANDGTIIPLDTSNTDYQAYISWLADGNTPLPAATPPGHQPDYQLLYDSILGSSVYQAIRTAATTSLPLTLACTEYIAAIGDAKAGRPNVPALQACIFNILQLADFSESQKTLLRGYIQDANLASVFIIP